MSNKPELLLSAKNELLSVCPTNANFQSRKGFTVKRIPSKTSKAEHNRRLKALKESENCYRRLFETAKDGILLLDAASGQITDVNPFLIDLLGYSREELLGKKLWEIGPFKDIAASRVNFRELQQKKYIRYEELPLESKQGNRVEVEFVSNLYEVKGKDVIQCNIRDISERIRTQDSLYRVNQELSALILEMQNHDREMKQINHMNDMLQACKTQEEAYQVIALAVGDLFSGCSGGLAIMNNSGRFLETYAGWGKEPLLEPVFSLDDCWAIRRGQQHEVLDPQAGVSCRHFIRPPQTGYMCLPLMVQGETLGLFHLEIPAGMSHEHALSWRQLVVTVAEGIKLSLSSLKLREIMSEQATHDPLTGLFNRRYLDDTLSRELTLARRHSTRTSIALLDVDHFKHFNDSFGHEAGDLILREVGQVLRRNIRRSDIACRYGGEEFVLVLLDSTLEASFQHLEGICSEVKNLQIHYGGQLLGVISFSVGLVEAPARDMSAEQLLHAADKALYAAKRSGRDRIVAFNDLKSKP